MHDTHLEIVSAILKAMSHPIRLKILYLLLDKELNTGEILAEIPTTNPNLSQHLNVLRDYGLITSRRKRSFVLNALADNRIQKILMDLQQMFQPHQ